METLLGLLAIGFLLVSLLLLVVYGGMAHFYHILARLRPQKTPLLEMTSTPFVTFQVTVCNEGSIVRDTLDALVLMEYPKDRYEIQICDDSTDVHTIEICAEAARQYQAEGFNIHHVRRTERKNFKAGNLNHATPLSKGEILVIVDADFLLPANFLKRNVPLMTQDPKVGAIQTYWTHRNKEVSPITQAQELCYDYHLLIEQRTWSNWGMWMQINGSACLVRRAALEEEGGWKTFFEDVYLSYRIQLQGWTILFSDATTSVALLPETIPPMRSQQVRWTRGSGLIFRELAGPLFRAKTSALNRLQGIFRLMSQIPYVGMTGLMLFSWPVIEWIVRHPQYSWLQWVALGSFVFLTTGTGSATAWAESKLGRGFLDSQIRMTWLSFQQAGLAPLLAWNYILGLLGYPLRSWVPSNAKAKAPRFHPEKLFEIVALLCAIFAVVRGIQTGLFGLLPPVIVFGAGLFWLLTAPFWLPTDQTSSSSIASATPKNPSTSPSQTLPSETRSR